MKVKSESEVAQLCQLLATPWTAAHQAPPSMGFSRQEYWSGVLLSSLMPHWQLFIMHCIYIIFIIVYIAFGASQVGASGKEPTCQCRRVKRPKFDPRLGKIPWRRACNPLKRFCLENPTNRGAWWATVHRVVKSQTWLKRLSTTQPSFYIVLGYYKLENAMALHSNTLAWKIPWTEELVGCSPWGR